MAGTVWGAAGLNPALVTHPHSPAPVPSSVNEDELCAYRQVPLNFEEVQLTNSPACNGACFWCQV